MPLVKDIHSCQHTLGIHRFYNDITCQLCNFSPRRFNLIEACILNGVLIESTNWITISILLLTYHLVSGYPVPSREQYLCIYILFLPLWGYLSFFVWNGICFGILQFVLVWIAPDLMIFQPERFFSFFISLLAAFDHGVISSICFKWHDASLSFLLKLPRTISLALSHVIASSTPSKWTRRDNASWATLLAPLGMSMIGQNCWQICEHLLPHLDTLVANNVSLYTLCGNLLYHNWWQFVLNCLIKDGCNTVQAQWCVTPLLSKNQMVKPWDPLGINLCYL